MIALFLTTTITCSQAYSVLNRIQTNKNLSNQIKTELLEEVKSLIPTCPVKVKVDAK